MVRRIIYILLAIVIGVLGGTIYYFQTTFHSQVSTKGNAIIFSIDEGDSSQNIAQDLKNKNLIRSPFAFLVYVKLKRYRLQAGDYSLKPTMTTALIAARLGHGEVAKATLTFPEGWRITQMADRLYENGIVKKEDFIKEAQGQEGYLFPDTYTFSPKDTAKDIIKEMRQNFYRRTEKLKPTPDIVILASIVEREAGNDKDRPTIASVYANRLKSGLRLESDPTIQYAKGSWSEITQHDYYATYSSYNTYLHAGLPPGPICNPGLKSLEAAANPASTDYYYFFHTKDGKTIYSKTLEEHNQNIKKYR